MARGWSVCSGIITLALIAKFLSLNEQGFYFTFASVPALQVIFELGLGTVLVQFVSHEMPKLKIIGGHVVGDDLNLQRFLSIIRLAIKWYIIIAIFVCVSVLPAGLYFFKLVVPCLSRYKCKMGTTVGFVGDCVSHITSYYSHIIYCRRVWICS